MKKIFILLSLLLIVACNPAKDSSKNSSDRYPVPSTSVPGNADWGNTSSTTDPVTSSTPAPSVSTPVNKPSSSTQTPVVSSPSISSPTTSSSSTPQPSSPEKPSSSSSADEDKPSNILPGEGFGGLH